MRFRSPMSDAQLQAFAKTAALRLVQRTRFSERQAVFAPLDAPQTFLPDLLEGLSRLDAVEQAWQDAESAYRRAV